MTTRGRLARIGAPVRVCLSACVYEPDPERRRLRQMLDSTVEAGTTDYAIAVDRKSTPGTVRWVRWHLLRRRGLLASLLRPARVVEFRWQDDFAHARNIALDLVPAECQWWYAIDADDRLECIDGARLPDYLGQLSPSVPSVCTPYLCPDPDGRLVCVMSYETFFRGPIAYRWRRAWGEVIEPLDRTGMVHGAPFRRVHDQDRAIPRSRSRNERVMLNALSEHPNDPGLWAFLGQHYAGLWRHSEAVDCLKKAIELANTARQRFGYSLGLIQPLILSARIDEALQLAVEMQRLQPNYPEGFIFEGRARFLRGEFASAVSAVEAAVTRMDAVARLEQRQHVGSLGNPIQLYECEPYLILADAFGQLGQFEEALVNAERALAAQPPVIFEQYIRGLRDSFRADERPPFIGAQFAEVMAATGAAIRKLGTYASEQALMRDLDDDNSELTQLLQAPWVDAEVITTWTEAYFGEQVDAPEAERVA